MVRNLGMANRTLLRPTRLDQCSAGPGEVSRTSAATISKGMASSSSAAPDDAASNSRFTSGQIPEGRVQQQVGAAGVRRQQGGHQEALAILLGSLVHHAGVAAQEAL